MWDLIVSVPDHCLSFYFVNRKIKMMIKEAVFNLLIKSWFN